MAGKKKSTTSGAGRPSSPPSSSPRSSSESPHGPEHRPRAHELHIWQIQAFRDILFVAAIVCIIWLGYVLSAVTVPLLVALLLAYLFEPLIQKLTRHEKINRPMAVGGLLCAIGLGFGLFFAIAIPLIIGQTIGFINDFQTGQIRSQVAGLIDHAPSFIREEVDDILDVLPRSDSDNTSTTASPPVEDSPASDAGGGALPDETAPSETDAQSQPPLDEQRVRAIVDEELLRHAASVPAEGGSPILGLAGSGVRTLWGLITASLYIALLFFLIPFYFYFFSVYWPAVLRFGRKLIPEKNKKRTVDLISKMDAVVSGFVRGRIIICLITGVLLAAGWFIADVPYAIVIGMITGIMFLVPYLGSLGFIVAVVVNVIAASGEPGRSDLWLLWAALWPTVVYVVVQFIESYILTPKIAGKATNLDPVTIVVAVLAGGTLLGVYGMLLAIPIAACGKILLVEVLFPKIDAWLRGERSDPLPIERGD